MDETPTSTARIEVLWRPGCPFCSRLRRGLTRAGIDTVERDIWSDPAAAARVRAGPWVIGQDLRAGDRSAAGLLGVAGAAGFAVAVLVTLGLSGSELLRGPAFPGFGGATSEALVLAGAGAALFVLPGLFRVFRGPTTRTVPAEGRRPLLHGHRGRGAAPGCGLVLPAPAPVRPSGEGPDRLRARCRGAARMTTHSARGTDSTRCPSVSSGGRPSRGTAARGVTVRS